MSVGKPYPELRNLGSGDSSQAPIPVTPTTTSEDQYDRIGAEMPTSFVEGLKAALQYTGESFPTVQALNWWERQQAAETDQQVGASKISAEEANRMFPVRDRPFTESIYPDVARMLSDDAARRHELASIILHSPQNLAAKGTRFVGSTLMGLADPMSIGAAMLGGAAFGAIGRAAGYGDSYLFRALAQGERLPVGQAFVRDAAHAAVGNAAIEPLIAGLSISDQQDYSMKDALKNMATFSFGYAATLGAFRGLRSSWERYMGGTEAFQKAKEAAVAQAATDRPVDVTPIVDQISKERSGLVPGEVVGAGRPFEHSPIADNADAAGRDYYVGASRSLGDVHNSNAGPIEGDYGPGIYMTENPSVANGHASSHFSDADGVVFQTKLAKELNLIDLDKPMPEKAQAVVEGLAHELGVKLKDGATAKEDLDVIREAIDMGRAPEDTFHDINAALQEQGFDGYRHEGGKFMGQDNPPHNIVQVFDSSPETSPVQQTGEYLGDVKSTPAMTPQEIADIADRSNQNQDALYQHDDAEAFREFIENPPKEMALPDIEQIENDTLETIKQLKSQGILSDEDQSLLDQLEEMTKAAAEADSAAKAAAACVAKDLLE